jgi:hypothetical protein
MLLAGAAIILSACWPDAEESTTREALAEDQDSIIRPGTVAPDSVLLPAGALDTSARDSTATADTAVRIPAPRS